MTLGRVDPDFLCVLCGEAFDVLRLGPHRFSVKDGQEKSGTIERSAG